MSQLQATTEFPAFITPTEAEIQQTYAHLGEMRPLFVELSFTKQTDDIERFIEIRNEIVSRNMPLVIAVATRFGYMMVRYRRGADPAITLDDLIQEGVIYLIKAISKFDPTKGFQFSTYAYWAVKRGIGRFLDNGKAIRFPAYIVEKIRKLSQVVSELSKNGEDPDVSQIACELSATETEVAELISMARMHTSILALDAPLVDGEDITLADLTVAEDQPIEEKLIVAEDIQRVRGLVDTPRLTPTERTVMKLRYGLTTEEELTLKAIGKQIGCSSERVRQIIESALEKLRLPSVWESIGDVALALGIFRPIEFAPKEWLKVFDCLESVAHVEPAEWNIHKAVSTVTRFYGISRQRLVTERSNKVIIAAQDLSIYLLNRKCLLSLDAIAEILGFATTTRCENGIDRIRRQVRLFERSDLWETFAIQRLFKSK